LPRISVAEPFHWSRANSLFYYRSIQTTCDFDAGATIPEMHDRIIVGAARPMNATLLTRDKQITKSRLVTTVVTPQPPYFVELTVSRSYAVTLNGSKFVPSSLRTL
jgi:hypothetical protein